ncbi:hypothetical protein BWJ02_29245 [Salmonella enterica]|nr:hypothetical protein [Salmonella enterica]EBL6729962.1 hypothetical protein [Salmonella enterica]EBO7766986.1 hypothetical protein [Salmonella enterica]
MVLRVSSGLFVWLSAGIHKAHIFYCCALIYYVKEEYLMKIGKCVGVVKNAFYSKPALYVGVAASAISASALAEAAGTAPDPNTIITSTMLTNISTPILVTIGAILTAAFGILTLKLVATVGMGLVKSLFSKAAN